MLQQFYSFQLIVRFWGRYRAKSKSSEGTFCPYWLFQGNLKYYSLIDGIPDFELIAIAHAAFKTCKTNNGH
ncbi:hypothetical protein [Nostoc sp. FACHB-133]|uniref:hypothetical protein n=1 Tax=Nostoc sp. FACHB-133 TaxID=2692835 RepID=UPI001687E1A0|nr:hypothetical protein [Nostoc sp. FACHB-133]MBD2527271.1 hypothetical protein [Nostoc sp. FACHB-133]